MIRDEDKQSGVSDFNPAFAKSYARRPLVSRSDHRGHGSPSALKREELFETWKQSPIK
jgi:hypothetical protein